VAQGLSIYESLRTSIAEESASIAKPATSPTGVGTGSNVE